METGSRSAYLAELLGTLSIVAAVTGAGFMVRDLGAQGALGLWMIAGTVAAVLFVSISALASFSGAHFNPAVTLAFLFRRQISPRVAAVFIAAQVLGGVLGAGAASLMFSADLTALSSVERSGSGSFFGGVVATAGLVILILLLVAKGKANLVAGSVAAWIFAGHVFTSSTSFANPAVTIGRVFTEAPSGIAPASALWFVIAQLVGLGLALFLLAALSEKENS